MPSAIVRQQSFRGGEVAPEFYGRTHDPRYGISLRTCKNFLPIVHGALVNRAGTIDFGSRGRAPRFNEFVFSDAQAMVLEFTAGVVRFWTNVWPGALAGVPYEVATPYVAADLARLNFAQAGDVVTITHPSYQPRELTRLSNTSWTLGLVTFSRSRTFSRAERHRHRERGASRRARRSSTRRRSTPSTRLSGTPELTEPSITSRCRTRT
jgi:hypothetical protein